MEITHEQLLKMHGKKITCDIEREHIDDARISVKKNDIVYVCQNIIDGEHDGEKFGYKFLWCISTNCNIYEKHNEDCTNIKLVEEEQEDLDLDQAIDDITPKQVITPPNHYKLEINNQVIDVNMILEAVAKKLDTCDLMTWAYFTNSIEYLLRSWFKGQQISDLEKAKSEIDFMINRIKGNKIMTNKCENCGCNLNNGICSNCQEELYIYENQNEFLPDNVSNDFMEKVKEQKEEIKLRIETKQTPTKLICDRCGKDLTLDTSYSTPNGCECEKCKDISVAEFTSWQNGDINSPLRKMEYEQIL